MNCSLSFLLLVAAAAFAGSVHAQSIMVTPGELIIPGKFTSAGSESLVLVDRAQAIAHTVQHAGTHDVVLVPRKGHEDYQEIAGVKHPFSDVQHARAALAARAQQGSAHV